MRLSKSLKILLIAFSIIILVGCQNQTKENMKDKNDEKQSEIEKTLVVYFSQTGTTKRLAEYAATLLNAHLYEIVATDPYSEEDLAYYTNGRADQEQNDLSIRPLITGSVNNMEDYDKIILAYPIWHSQAPRIMDTFLESYDFSNKTIIPFCTSNSSGVSASVDHLRTLTSTTTSWKEGKRFDKNTSKNELERFLKGLFNSSFTLSKRGTSLN